MRGVLALGLLGLASAAISCCAVAKMLVQFGGQSNIIVWDAKTKTEHFIRDARFKTNAPDLGFIAPTPNKPDIVEVDPAAFETLIEAVRWNDVQMRMDGTKATSMETSVSVVQIKRVAGLVATTLLASDASGLATWMKQRGYKSSATIQEWTQFYIDKGWFLTLFKIDASAGRAETGLVRMSFRTDRPFNPHFGAERQLR